MTISRRNLLAAGGSTAMIAMVGSASWSLAQSVGQQAQTSPDLIVHNAKVTTLQGGRPQAQAFVVQDQKMLADRREELFLSDHQSPPLRPASLHPRHLRHSDTAHRCT